MVGVPLLKHSNSQKGEKLGLKILKRANKINILSDSYIEKYNPSRQQTKTFLLKKYLTKFQGSKNRKEVSEIIDKIVVGLEKKFVNVVII